MQACQLKNVFFKEFLVYTVITSVICSNKLKQGYGLDSQGMYELERKEKCLNTTSVTLDKNINQMHKCLSSSKNNKKEYTVHLTCVIHLKS